MAIELGALNQAHHGRRPLARTQRAREQPVAPTNGDWPDLVLDPVVVDGQAPVLHKPGQCNPAFQAVVQRFGGGRPIGEARSNVPSPRLRSTK